MDPNRIRAARRAPHQDQFTPHRITFDRAHGHNPKQGNPRAYNLLASVWKNGIAPLTASLFFIRPLIQDYCKYVAKVHNER